MFNHFVETDRLIFLGYIFGIKRNWFESNSSLKLRISNAQLIFESNNPLWNWFGLSYASWLTLPRVLMHEMPTDWQRKMAELLHEWDDTWDYGKMEGIPYVSFKDEAGKYMHIPFWLKNYRHPDHQAIEWLRVKKV